MMPTRLEFNGSAAAKVAELIAEEVNAAFKLRVCISRGGCSGFQYGFGFYEHEQEGELVIEKASAALVGPFCFENDEFFTGKKKPTKAGFSCCLPMLLVNARLFRDYPEC